MSEPIVTSHEGPRTATLAARTSIHAAVWGREWRAEVIGATLAQAAMLGYGHVIVPLRRFEDVDPTALARVFAAHRIAPLNACGLAPDRDIGSADSRIRQRGVDHLLHAIALARDMGSTQIGGVLHGPLGKAAHAPTRDDRSRAAESLHAVADAAAIAGVRLALELVNRYENALLNTVAQGLAFLAQVDHPNLWLHLDTFHMSIEEAAPFDALAAALPRLAYLELDQSHRGDAFEGSLDLVHWCRQAKRVGYEGLVGVEAFSRGLLADEHADALAIWQDRFDDGTRVARGFMQVIEAGFGD